jgi:hypothetical protein
MSFGAGKRDADTTKQTNNYTLAPANLYTISAPRLPPLHSHSRELHTILKGA